MIAPVSSAASASWFSAMKSLTQLVTAASILAIRLLVFLVNFSRYFFFLLDLVVFSISRMKLSMTEAKASLSFKNIGCTVSYSICNVRESVSPEISTEISWVVPLSNGWPWCLVNNSGKATDLAMKSPKKFYTIGFLWLSSNNAAWYIS